MDFFRQYIAPLFIFVIFFIALAAVSARIFLPSDMAGPAIMDESISQRLSIPQPGLAQPGLAQPGLAQPGLAHAIVLAAPLQPRP